MKGAVYAAGAGGLGVEVGPRSYRNYLSVIGWRGIWFVKVSWPTPCLDVPQTLFLLQSTV